ncbi:MAG TPA: tetratricopeptide repeat protein [Thermosynechococcaceae cyanobacterium]
MNLAKGAMTADDFMRQAGARSEEGDYLGAVQSYGQAIQLAPDYARAYGNRGLVRLNLGDKRGALEDWQNAAKLFLTQGSTTNYEMALGYIRKLESNK